MTVAQLLATTSSAEVSEWMAYYRLEPWGEQRADWRAGVIASTVANVHRKKGRKAFQPKDFMPDYEAASQPKHVSLSQKIKGVFMNIGKGKKS